MNLICSSVFPGYSILYTADPSLPDNQWSLIDVFGDVTSARVPDLQQESTYYFRIQARSNSGDESTSRTVAYRTPDGQCRRTLSPLWLSFLLSVQLTFSICVRLSDRWMNIKLHLRVISDRVQLLRSYRAV